MAEQLTGGRYGLPLASYAASQGTFQWQKVYRFDGYISIKVYLLHRTKDGEYYWKYWQEYEDNF